MKFGVLGPVVIVGAEPVVLRPRERAVFTLLLLNHGRILSVSRLVEELWAERPPSSATNLVQQYVSRIRGQLRRCGGPEGAARLETRHPGYLLNCDGAELDVRRFDGALSQARDAAGRGRRIEAVSLLKKGLDLWRGAALCDVQRTSMIAAEADRLEEQRLQAVEERLDAELALGRHDDLVGELTALVTLNPLRERLHCQLMLALYRCGRQIEALNHYRESRHMMVADFGVEPGDRLRRLERDILNSAPDLNAPQPPYEGSYPLQFGLV